MPQALWLGGERSLTFAPARGLNLDLGRETLLFTHPILRDGSRAQVLSEEFVVRPGPWMRGPWPNPRRGLAIAQRYVDDQWLLVQHDGAATALELAPAGYDHARSDGHRPAIDSPGSIDRWGRAKGSGEAPICGRALPRDRARTRSIVADDPGAAVDVVRHARRLDRRRGAAAGGRPLGRSAAVGGRSFPSKVPALALSTSSSPVRSLPRLLSPRGRSRRGAPAPLRARRGAARHRGPARQLPLVAGGKGGRLDSSAGRPVSAGRHRSGRRRDRARARDRRSRLGGHARKPRRRQSGLGATRSSAQQAGVGRRRADAYLPTRRVRRSAGAAVHHAERPALRATGPERVMGDLGHRRLVRLRAVGLQRRDRRVAPGRRMAGLGASARGDRGPRDLHPARLGAAASTCSPR